MFKTLLKNLYLLIIINIFFGKSCIHFVCSPAKFEIFVSGKASRQSNYHADHFSYLMQHEALSFDLDHTKLVAVALKRHAALLI